MGVDWRRAVKLWRRWHPNGVNPRWVQSDPNDNARVVLVRG